jgi:uncharacterized protein (TIGR02001 family)
MKKSLLAVAAATVLMPLAATTAHAQLSANVALTSNYKFRGQDQGTVKDVAPAIQGGFDYAAGSFYLGNWNSNTGIGIEMDFYGGYKFQLGGVAMDVGVLHYHYPDTSTADTTELYLGGSLGMFGLKYSHTVSSKYFGAADSQGTGYFALSANPEIAKGLTANLAVGYTAGKGGVTSYTDYKAGITYDLGSGMSAAAALVGADATGPINKTRFILTLSKAM